ncbi:hypothetical protein KXE51_003436 [Salmonella enterica]|nr:hypothetical protein [Salmonella enterica]
MNYQKIHDSIIRNAKLRVKSSLPYSERHHIKPRSMGGSNQHENLVYLTLEEHYMVHLLLTKIYPYHHHLKLSMKGLRNRGCGARTNKQYGEARKIHHDHLRSVNSSESRKIISQNVMLGKTHNDESKYLMSTNGKGKGNGRILSEDTKTKISNHRKGKPLSEETRKRLSESHKGNINSPETRAKISEALKSKKMVPWETPYSLSKGTHIFWLLANKFYEWWTQDGKLTHTNRYRSMLSDLGVNCPHTTAMNCIKKFQEGWIPESDPDWLQFYEEHK